MFDEFVHVNNVFLSPDVAGFIVHGQDAAEAFSVAPAQQVKSAHKTISIITILIPMSYHIYLCKNYLTF